VNHIRSTFLLGNISVQDDGGDVTEGLASSVVLTTLVLSTSLGNQSSEFSLVATDVFNDSDSGSLGVLLGGSGEVAEEGFVDGGNLRAVGLELVVITIEGNNISDQSDGVGVSGVQVSKGFVDVLKDGDVSTLVDVSIIVDLEIIVEAFEEKSSGAGTVTEVVGEEPVVADSGGGKSDKDGEEDELVHLS